MQHLAFLVAAAGVLVSDLGAQGQPPRQVDGSVLANLTKFVGSGDVTLMRLDAAYSGAAPRKDFAAVVVGPISEPMQGGFYAATGFTQNVPGLEPMSTISITLSQDGDKTQMVFKQSDIASKQMRDGGLNGWAPVFDRLSEYISGL